MLFSYVFIAGIIFLCIPVGFSRRFFHHHARSKSISVFGRECQRKSFQRPFEALRRGYFGEFGLFSLSDRGGLNGAEDEESIEELVARASREQKEKLDQEKEREELAKKGVVKRKKDKEYEAYWQRQGKSGKDNNEALTQLMYYNMIDTGNVNRTETIAKLSRSDEWDYSSQPVNGRESFSASAVFAGLVGVGLAAKVISDGVSDSSGGDGFGTGRQISGRPVDSRAIKRDYSMEDLKRSVRNSASSSLSPSLSLPKSFGSMMKLSNEDKSVPESFFLDGVTTVLVVFRPSDPFSTRIALDMKRVSDQFPDDLKFVGVVVPKYTGESRLLGLDSSSSPFRTMNLLEDTDRSVWRDLQLTSWPTVLICTGKAENVVFAIEAQRCAMQLMANAVASAVSVISGNAVREDTILKAFSSQSRDPGSTPLATVKGRLSSPTRACVDFRTGNIYLSDTGNGRVLELSPEGKVLREFNGDERNPFRRPMGLSIRYDASYGGRNEGQQSSSVLFVADSGCDTLFRIDLGTGVTSSVFISPADTDTSGSVYSFPELQQVLSKLGKSLKSLSDIPAEEAYSLLSSAGLKDDPLAQEIIGRSRKFIAPTDIAGVDAFQYVSVAGSRQIWRIEDNGFSLRPVYGSGLEGSSDCSDISLSALTKGLKFGQPAGLAGSSGRLIFADSDGCSIRIVNLLEGYTTTVIGKASKDSFRDAFKIGKSRSGDSDINLLSADVYGDSGGSGNRARMQHPTAVCLISSDDILLADTLNNKIKRISVDGNEATIQTFLGRESQSDGLALNVPQGVAYDRNRKLVYIVDTGNNRLLTSSLDGKNVKRFDISF